MSDDLEVWEVLHSPWSKLGTIVRTGGKGGTIACKPKSLESLLRNQARRCGTSRALSSAQPVFTSHGHDPR